MSNDGGGEIVGGRRGRERLYNVGVNMLESQSRGRGSSPSQDRNLVGSRFLFYLSMSLSPSLSVLYLQ